MSTNEHHEALKMICAGGFKSAIQRIAPLFTSKFGIRLEIAFGAPAHTREIITDGSGFDVVVVTQGSLNEAAALQLDSESSFLVAKSPVGMGLRMGLEKREINDVALFRDMICSLESVGLSDPKAGTNLGNDILASAEKLGFGDDLRSRAVFILGPGSVVSLEVGKGKPDAVITLQSEIINVDGVQFLGAIPDAMGLGTPFVAGKALLANTNPEARLFLEFLKSDEARDLMIEAGLLPL